MRWAGHLPASYPVAAGRPADPRAYEDTCLLCGGTENLRFLPGKAVCQRCVDELNNRGSVIKKPARLCQASPGGLPFVRKANRGTPGWLWRSPEGTGRGWGCPASPPARGRRRLGGYTAQKAARPLRAMPPIEKTRPKALYQSLRPALTLQRPAFPPAQRQHRPSGHRRCQQRGRGQRRSGVGGRAPRSQSCPSTGRRARKSRFLPVPDPAAPAYRGTGSSALS